MQVNETLAEREPVVELANGWKMVGTTTYGTVPSGNYFIGTSNGVQKFYKSKGTSKLRADRAYFIAPSTVNQTASSANFSYVMPAKNVVKSGVLERNIEPIDFDSRLFMIMGPDNVEDETDDISTMTVKIVNHVDDAIYNMNGQKVGDASSRNQLPKGVYISNNKKIVIK